MKKEIVVIELAQERTFEVDYDALAERYPGIRAVDVGSRQWHDLIKEIFMVIWADTELFQQVKEQASEPEIYLIKRDADA